MTTPSVGGDIEDSCNRCGDTWHVVMAKVEDRVVKVVCKLCGGQHNYRNIREPVAAKTAGSGTGRRVFRKRVVPRNVAPVPVTPTFDASKPPRPYAAGDGYQSGERVEHPKFGVGVVSGIPGPGKAEVVFPSGTRVLACAKTASKLERPSPVKVPVADRPPDNR